MHVQQLVDLTGRVAVVTGGSRGLGAEIADGLAEAGASLMLGARREQWLAPALEEFRGKRFRVESHARGLEECAIESLLPAREENPLAKVPEWGQTPIRHDPLYAPYRADYLL